MKQHTCNHSTVSTFLKSLVLAFAITTAIGTKAMAQTNPLLNSTEIRLVGTVDAKPLYEVKLTNAAGERFSISIKDTNGTILFTDTYQEKRFEKKFLFDAQEAGDLPDLVFTICTVKDNQAQSFQVNKRITEEVVITKIH